MYTELHSFQIKSNQIKSKTDLYSTIRRKRIRGKSPWALMYLGHVGNMQ